MLSIEVGKIQGAALLLNMHMACRFPPANDNLGLEEDEEEDWLLPSKQTEINDQPERSTSGEQRQSGNSSTADSASRAEFSSDRYA